MNIRLSYDAPTKTYHGWDTEVDVDERVVIAVPEADAIARLPEEQRQVNATFAPIIEGWVKAIVAERLGAPAPKRKAKPAAEEPPAE